MFFPRFSYTSRYKLLILLLLGGTWMQSTANPKAPVASGNWSNPAIWGGTTVPTNSDNVTIQTGQTIVMDTDITIKDLTVSDNASLTFSPGKRLTINGNTVINGNTNMNGGNITLGSPGLFFTLGANAVFTWDPGINTTTEATLFTRGVENFASSSTLIIKKWFSYSTPLGSVITGDFGNLTLNSLSGASAIVEWDQANQFQTHKVLGTLTIDQGWITLDKSGTISNTILSNVVLTSVNSFFYGHNGNHPGSFEINTGSITNNGGTVIGLNDGTGNVTLKVVGNFTNIGNVKVIMNSGVAGAGNGNATFTVTGTYSQSTGDTRFIYNVASLSSGIFTSNFGGLNLTGGIFMGQTGCHVNSGTCSMNVTNNMTVNFINNSDKFRGTSLSSIGVTNNNVLFNLTVGGNLSFSGPASAEFTSSASLGTESINISGNLQVAGGIFSINYGTSSSAHATTLQVNGNLAVTGGTTFLTRNAGVSSIIIGGDATIATGMLILKGADGIVNMTVRGQYNQSSGTVYLHGNSGVVSTDKISLWVQGNFSHSGGILSFDDNSSNLNATHEIIISGAQYSLSGTGTITHAGQGTSLIFGLIRFNRNGTMQFQRTTGHQLLQVKQIVEANCVLSVNSGSIQVCSHANAATDYLVVKPLGRLQLKTGQILSEASFTNSGIQIDSGGILEIQAATGMYNGSSTGSINSSGNMNYFLDANSIVEYAGTSDQTLTGNSYAMTTGAQHKYGILRIKLANTNSAIITESQVYTRTNLALVSGSIDLNGKSLVIENGNSDALTRTNGFVKSESDDGSIIWNNMSGGTHEFPFGTQASIYLPVYFTPLTGIGNSVSISTRSTGAPDNLPTPSNLLSTVLSLVNIGFAENDVIDRWWKVSATGMTANVTLKYNSPENTLSIANRLSPLGLRIWSGLSWTEPRGYGFAILSGIGSVTISNVSQFSNWILAVNNAALPIELSLFQAKALKNKVRLDWVTTTEINNEFFIIERSDDGIIFQELAKVPGAGNSSEQKIYSYLDENPLSGRSFYRLKQTDYDGKFTYSEIKSVYLGEQQTSKLQIESVAPNPFDNYFRTNYTMPESGEVRMRLTNSAGKVVTTKIVQGEKGTNILDFSEGANLQSGTYILQLIWKDQMTSQKLIKK